VQRLWTLQEGWFSHTLWFQFRDGAISWHEIMWKIETDRVHQLETLDMVDPISCRSAPHFFELGNVGKHGEGDDIVHIWHSMQWRSTTRKADEAVCLAILLYLDPSPLLECPEEERLPKIFASLRSVPPDIIFCPGEKIQYPGLRVGDILGPPAERD
jgi:hypothetical protein